MRMKFIINNQTIRCVTQSNIAAGTSNYVGADFQFMSGEWDGLVKWATFIGDDGAVHRFSLVDDSINESATMGLNLTSGSWSCYVYGDEIVAGEIAKRLTTTECHFNVNAVSELSEITTMPSEFETLMALAEGIKSEVSVMKTEVNIAKGEAEAAAEDAEEFADESEAWAVGQRDGVDVPSTDPAYHNNSKYYAERCKAPIIGESAPTSATVGAVGQFYLYGTNLYVCTSATTTYTWVMINKSLIWGNIEGTLANQTDLDTRFTGIEDDVDDLETAVENKMDVPTKINTGATITLADNTEYRLTDVTALTLSFPSGNFDSWICLTTASSGNITITFPNTTKYIGTVPTFGNSETWEISIKDGIVVAGKAALAT